jgi:class 3 adenylate cyclase
VHAEAGFVCPECGSDLRKVGIVAGSKRRWRGPSVRFLIFAVLWTAVCVGLMVGFYDTVRRYAWPIEIDIKQWEQLGPQDGAYPGIKITDTVRGVLIGARACSTPLKDHPNVSREIVGTLDCPDGPIVLTVDLTRGTAWRRSGGSEPPATGERLDKSVVLDWMKTARSAHRSLWPEAQAAALTQREADELTTIFNHIASVMQAGETCDDHVNQGNVIGQAIQKYGPGALFVKGVGSDGGVSEYVPMALTWVPAWAIIWAVGLWRWCRRRPRVSGAEPAMNGIVTASDPGPGHTSRVLSIMFSDVKDFTSRSAAQSRAGLLEIVRQHRDHVAPIAQRHRGWIVKEMGDGILIAFDSATDAVLAGLEIQRKTSASNHSALELRIAVSTGEIVVNGHDVFGPAVNLASRVQQLAEPGQVLLTETTAALLNGQEVTARHFGTFEVKGISEAVTVYVAEPVTASPTPSP